MSDGIQKLPAPVDVLRVIPWQYNLADAVHSLAEHRQAWLKSWVTDEISRWTHDVFDPRTASRFGLMTWVRILCARTDIPAYPYGQISDAGLRLIVLLTYYRHISRGDITQTNAAVDDVLALTHGYAPGEIDVWDDHAVSGQDDSLRETRPRMMMTTILRRVPNKELAWILRTLDVIPRPATVGVRYRVVVSGHRFFGFGSAKARGNFGSCFFKDGGLESYL